MLHSLESLPSNRFINDAVNSVEPGIKADEQVEQVEEAGSSSNDPAMLAVSGIKFSMENGGMDRKLGHQLLEAWDPRKPKP